MQNPRQGIVPLNGLLDDDRGAVEQLAEVCSQHEKVELPLNLDAVASDTGNVPAQLLYYEQGQLIGLVTLAVWGTDVEVTGMVHPEHRRKGIGRTLLATVRDVVKQRGAGEFLIICDEAAGSGPAFATAVGAERRFAEYSMTLDPAMIDRSRPRHGDLILRPADATDIETLTRIQAAAFGDPDEIAREGVLKGLHVHKRQYFIGELRGEPIGVLRVGRYADNADVTAFGVVPEHQGHGYGRQMLLDTVDMLLGEKWARIQLDVVTENRNALHLYQSCGFQETTTYGYYALGA